MLWRWDGPEGQQQEALLLSAGVMKLESDSADCADGKEEEEEEGGMRGFHSSVSRRLVILEALTLSGALHSEKSRGAPHLMFTAANPLSLYLFSASVMSSYYYTRTESVSAHFPFLLLCCAVVPREIT